MLRIRALISISFVSTIAFAGLAIADLDKNIVEDYLLTHPSSAAAKSRGSSHAPKPSAQELVRIVYLVPSDRTEREDYREAIERAALDIQAFYQRELSDALQSHAGVGETFALKKHPVEVFLLPGSSDYYNSFNSEGFAAFFVHVLEDAFAVTGGSFDDPDYRWIYYVDADNGCGQVTGAFGSVALMPANDLRGLTEQPSVECPPNQPHVRGFCGTVGGLGHELGHTLGLPHPPGCDEGNCSAEAFYSIMFFGYAFYPDTYFLDEDKDRLHQSPFISVEKIRVPKENCRGERQSRQGS